LATALKLREAGKNVVIIEAHRVGMGVGGFSTAKLCSLQRTAFSQIGSKFGEDVVKAYARMNQEGNSGVYVLWSSSGSLLRGSILSLAIDDIERVVTKYNIDCCSSAPLIPPLP
jgi:glycine/D-amino acid oxidase-like deaminating enzyme